MEEDTLKTRDPSFSLTACLAGLGLHVKSVTPLSGGLVNYIWRIADENGRSFILKHAEATLKLNASIESDPVRLSYEARGLQDAMVRRACAAVSGISVPKVVSYDSGLHTLVMTDEGEQSLAAAYEAGELDMKDVGVRLATFTAALHSATYDAPPGTWDNPHAESVSMVAAAGLPDCMERHGYARQTGEIARDGFFALQADERACCVQGDLRPGNMLVKQDGSISIIDWEDSRRQSPAIDLRLFAAQAYLLDVLHGERGLLEAFLTTYQRRMGDLCDVRVAQRTAVMFGGFLVFWLPQMDLCSAEESARLASYGAEMIHRVIEDDMEWLRDSRLGPLFQS